MGDGAVRETIEAKACAQAHVDASRLRPSLGDMAASGGLFQVQHDKTQQTTPDALDFGHISNLYGNDIIAQMPQKQPKYERGADGKWHFENPRAHGNDLAGKLKEWAWNDAPNLPRDSVNSAWSAGEPVQKVFNDSIQRAVNVFEQKSGHSPWRDVSFAGTDKAYSAFPELAQYNIPKQLISGIILNEVLHSGDPRDVLEDLSVRMFGKVRNWDGTENPEASIGPAQMQSRNINYLTETYPQLAEFKSDPLRAAVEPENAPMFVAAYLADGIKQLESYNRKHDPSKQIRITVENLAYLYNADVLRSGNRLRHTEPFDQVAKLLHIDAKKGWHSEPLPVSEIVRHSKVVQDILSGMRACQQ